MRKYTSRYITSGNSYIRRVFLPFFCTVGFLIILAIAAGFLTASAGGIQSPLLQWTIVLGLFLITASVSVIMLRIGNHALRDALVFCMDDNANLYAVDARSCANVSHRRSVLRRAAVFFKITIRTGSILDQIAESDGLENIRAHAVQIISVAKLQHTAGGRFVTCTVSTGSGAKRTQKYDVSNHTEALWELLRQRSASGKWETGQKTYAKQISLSAALLLLCLALCIAAHPSAGMLPEGIYFPGLFALTIPVILLCTFILKGRRGE